MLIFITVLTKIDHSTLVISYVFILVDLSISQSIMIDTGIEGIKNVNKL